MESTNLITKLVFLCYFCRAHRLVMLCVFKTKNKTIFKFKQFMKKRIFRKSNKSNFIVVSLNVFPIFGIT